MLVFAGAAALLPAAPATASSCTSAGGAMEYVTPVTFHVAIKPFKKTYRRGQTVKVGVVVTRPAEEDPVGLGLGTERPASLPAGDVNVGVGISIGRVFLPGYGRTNDKGQTTVEIRIEKYAPSAVAQVRAFAYKEILSSPCLTVEEQGFRSVANAFRVR